MRRSFFIFQSVDRPRYARLSRAPRGLRALRALRMAGVQFDPDGKTLLYILYVAPWLEAIKRQQYPCAFSHARTVQWDGCFSLSSLYGDGLLDFPNVLHDLQGDPRWKLPVRFVGVPTTGGTTNSGWCERQVHVQCPWETKMQSEGEGQLSFPGQAAAGRLGSQGLSSMPRKVPSHQFTWNLTGGWRTIFL